METCDLCEEIYEICIGAKENIQTILYIMKNVILIIYGMNVTTLIILELLWKINIVQYAEGDYEQ